MVLIRIFEEEVVCDNFGVYPRYKVVKTNGRSKTVNLSSNGQLMKTFVSNDIQCNFNQNRKLVCQSRLF